MTVFRLVLQSNVEDDPSDQSQSAMTILHTGWEDRATRRWVVSEEAPSGDPVHPTRLTVRASLADCPVRHGHRMIRIEADVEAASFGAALNRLRLALGLSVDGPGHPRKTPDVGIMALPTITRLRSRQVIGPMAADWPVGRNLTDYSQSLGSYGQGGIGLSGWQLNGGSWIVLPIAGSSGWITLRTIERLETPFDRADPRFDFAIDQRIVGANPEQIVDFPPWEHRFGPGSPTIEDMPSFRDLRARVSRFEARADGFSLEAANGLDRWIFEMGDHLPRPVWAGSGKPRLLDEGVDVGASFVMTHDCYLDV